ncbi:site-specific integrase [Pontixanthobacter gangjinensis]|uniref:Tyrosine-type recombinase/integrase n=1 Tax=Christiangramia aestuarii TaxID=1028746 RepID=A0A7K1LPI6_9FLAO|nr:site-specific tyrosine recombinase/integron integrase [Christiangramia aestuarii]MUP42480.1 tyrosine-type recombinase/integrase [Christiangramia aestuarii]
MKKVTLDLFKHQANSLIAIKFDYDRQMIEHLKLLEGISWSNSFGCFYLEAEKKKLNRLITHLISQGYFVDYSAIDFSRLPDLPENSIKNERKEITDFRNYLNGHRYSSSTIESYTNFVEKFLRFHDFKEFYVFKDVDRFVEAEIAARNYSISSHRQCISALKHYFEFTEQEEIDPSQLKRPEKTKYLPGVLSKEEVIDLLVATRNLKHRCILALIYSSGLRIGELINLRLKDIDVDRRQILIRQAKGRKDRYVMLAETFLPLFHNYLQTYAPGIYFAEGLQGGKYTASAIRSFLKESCHRARIKKRVTPHTLRHSYATHMLENGIDIRYIQELLGHSRPETTMIYTHVTQKDLSKIRSPLDESLKELMQGPKRDSYLRLSRNILE